MLQLKHPTCHNEDGRSCVPQLSLGTVPRPLPPPPPQKKEQQTLVSSVLLVTQTSSVPAHWPFPFIPCHQYCLQVPFNFPAAYPADSSHTLPCPDLFLSLAVSPLVWLCSWLTKEWKSWDEMDQRGGSEVDSNGWSIKASLDTDLRASSGVQCGVWPTTRHQDFQPKYWMKESYLRWEDRSPESGNAPASLNTGSQWTSSWQGT